MSDKSVSELRHSEELHRAILNNISDAVFMTDDAGNLTYTCPNAGIIFGYSPEEFAARPSIVDFLGNTVIAPEIVHQQGYIQNLEVEILDKMARPHILL